jgi:hypothetical protein
MNVEDTLDDIRNLVLYSSTPLSIVQVLQLISSHLYDNTEEEDDECTSMSIEDYCLTPTTADSDLEQKETEKRALESIFEERINHTLEKIKTEGAVCMRIYIYITLVVAFCIAGFLQEWSFCY